ncbi:ABC transporter permease subunit [Streptomyces sp. NPDC056835]|uniref:ABC transporter permease subunit n=1 Tax=Streptomyces sp. NPDC056835 TaxID=3345956 RepID=UPI00369E7FD7
MTATATDRPGQRSARVGFAQLLRAEWTKFRTVRGWVLAMAAAALVCVAVGLLGTAAPGTGRGAAPAVPQGPDGEAVNDSFYFVRQSLAGDGSITVPVTSLTGVISRGPGDTARGTAPWAKAGLIVKANRTQGSAYAAIMVTGSHGVRMQHNYVHDAAGIAGTTSADSPRWLRLVRSGDLITGYNSTDGTHWTRVGAARLAGLPSTVQAGLFVTSPEATESTGVRTGYAPAVATARFGRVNLRGQWSGTSWRGEQLGGTGTTGSYTDTTGGGFKRSAGGFTVTGAGDIAPAVGGPASGGSLTIESFLVGVFAGLVIVIVVSTSFITTEYRRGLIRTTLAASPRRGRVLASKAIVVGALAFAGGLVAAVAIPIGAHSARARGFYVFPVPLPTELRVVVGTALLLAVTAVLALAVGAVLRRGAAAATLTISAIVLPYLLAVSGVLPATASQWLLRVTPAAGFAIEQSLRRYPQVLGTYTPSSGYFPLAPWAGFTVLCGYAVVALAAAVLLLRRRDA